MQLFHSHFSPFARKVMVVAHELGLTDRIALLPTAAHPVTRDAAILRHHPLAQVPTLIDDDGFVLADSRVICEYLDTLSEGGIFPSAGPARWDALALQSTADGLLDAALLIRYELTARAEAERSAAWIAGQEAKIATVLADVEAQADGLGERVDIGVITLGCAIGYLDLRFPDPTRAARLPKTALWYEGFAQRPSMVATRPPAA
ncbi:MULTISPECIES: glutathione S-transferase [unclassified Methylobacterium]|uniref:glutathione S-transferase family protein n=1 Tax=unclassified Methylobacterium TaxID=2615210 RepID=UPI0006FFB258|nr:MULTISPECIES: glutathione S-transferase [unclassified Methylobacterium]KQP50492.1 glutathione S-transferase [Methylobacterium sp. Leaf108]KQT78738.1 glutathione S-transferase [Methylobacterium sp. Leaf466]